MNSTAMRRGLVVAFGGLALAGVVAVGQPASAASPVNTSGPVPPAAVSAVGAASAAQTSATARNQGGGVRASHLDGVCNTYSSGYGDLCLWYLQNYTGSHADFYFGDGNLNDNYFNSPGAGQGQRVGNNSESDWNYDRHLTARVFTGVNYTGVAGDIAPYTGGNFNSTFRNNVESFYWV
ncbi:peptidase inhibitor family I36 protein [Frankia sp. AgB32]|uniref:peptidase inhibitor family I36 protein n=1 Tax=Frankia sp. AgB32 TaxID=631119 RepID=UPI00200E1B89|nr:peptidase inhibitor family I36 protein [Frankia sp. AgB32]MCK9895321.1 peptidase inhibitor family I36 protein [Frankia sp. AgB32]